MNNPISSAIRVGILILVLLLSLGVLGRLGIFGDWGYSLFGSMGMILMWFIPIALIVLTFLGIVRFLQGRSRRSMPTAQVCPIAQRACSPIGRSAPPVVVP